ncbi:hypothetical protein PbB2_01596 [Candidatus Phycosocius bacilliformis]|uniref:Uncharacterized protein n=1 Tax=Candidatus Phycosocius bacilliformis TaxID=1445552 RepID=A0A2P2EA36_9PROT|nr:hypothetical protein PbB2_01596 [Candidatus Phycosocius bacilliformis]
MIGLSCKSGLDPDGTPQDTSLSGLWAFLSHALSRSVMTWHHLNPMISSRRSDVHAQFCAKFSSWRAKPGIWLFYDAACRMVSRASMIVDTRSSISASWVRQDDTLIRNAGLPRHMVVPNQARPLSETNFWIAKVV